MPEYLAPGVYVEEFAAAPASIPGVPTSTIDIATAQRLVAAIRPVIEEMQPEWSDFNHRDPGVTLIELFAYLTDSLLFRSVPDWAERSKAARRLAYNLTIAAGACAAEGGTLKRPHYFAGKRLDAATLQAEQDYHREKRRRHNRHLHGCGIVCGLEVRVDATSDVGSTRIVIEPGYALDANGDDVAVASCVRIALPPAGDAVFVSIRAWDHPCAAVPAAAGEIDSDYVEEACLVAFTPDATPPALAIARLLRSTGGWAVDAAFVPQRST
ncbi:MAG: hypothetical protein ABI593_01220 [Betaproteobacteria bacterium]